MEYWLIKSEPEECGLIHFIAASDQGIPWDGVRNYQARNFIRAMQPGDRVLLYHSSCQHVGIAGKLRVISEPYPDSLQFEPDSPYFDAKATRVAPRWTAIDLALGSALPRLVPLAELKTMKAFKSSPLVKKGNRLSVMPLTREQWQAVEEIA
jgi:predicted RNA-binding protein with PUA-like domain